MDDQMFLDGVLLDVKVSYWRGKKTLTPEDLGLTKQQVPEIFRLGTKMIVPKQALDEFERIESRVQYLTDRWAFPFPTGRAHFVPYTVLPEVTVELTGLRQRFDAEVIRFMGNLAQYRERLAAQYPQYKEAIERGAMDEASTRRKFGYSWTLYEVKLPKDLHLKAISDKEAREKADAQRKALGQAEEAFRKQYQEQVDAFLNESVGRLRVLVLNAVSTLADQVKEGKVNQGTVRAVREAISRFRSLNFVGDAGTEVKLQELEGLLPADKVEPGPALDILAAAVQSTVEAATKDDIPAVAEQYRRRIRVDAV